MRIVALVVVAIVQPALAFTYAKDLVFLLSGHGSALAFATLALWMTFDGGFTSSRPERALYVTVGSCLAGKNVFLCVGLMTRVGSRALDTSNGSFGMTNDYIRAAEDVFGWRLETVALVMLFASLATILLWRARSSR